MKTAAQKKRRAAQSIRDKVAAAAEAATTTAAPPPAAAAQADTFSAREHHGGSDPLLPWLMFPALACVLLAIAAVFPFPKFPTQQEGIRSLVRARPVTKVLSWEPRIFLVEGVLTPEECDALIAQSKGKLTTVGTFELTEKSTRTSQSMWFSEPEDASSPAVTSVRSALLDLVLAPSTHAEALQLTRYEVGERYDLHYDFSQPRRSDAAKYPFGDVERHITVVAYLTDDFEGGETVFPRVSSLDVENPRNLLERVPDADDPVWEKVGGMDSIYCDPARSDALRARPARRGGAVIFFGYKPDGRTRDMDTIHGSCPVRRGVKVIAQQWIQGNLGYAATSLVMESPRHLMKKGLAKREEYSKDCEFLRSTDAVATLVTTPEYAVSAYVLGKTLAATMMRDCGGKNVTLVAIVAPHSDDRVLVGKKEARWLALGGWRVRRVPRLHHVGGERRGFLRPDLAAVSYSKIHAWDMHGEYGRVLFIDADAMVTRSIAFLFAPEMWDPPHVVDINGVREVNGQVKTGLFGLRPSPESFARLVEGLENDDLDFTNNEQGYVSKVFSKEWQSVPEHLRMPYHEHLCSGACSMADESPDMAAMWRRQVRSAAVVDFQGLSKPWVWPAEIPNPHCRVMRMFAILWQTVLLAPTVEATREVLDRFAKVRAASSLLKEEGALVRTMMDMIEAIGAHPNRASSLQVVCESGFIMHDALQKYQLPIMDFGGIFGQLCAMNDVTVGKKMLAAHRI